MQVTITLKGVLRVLSIASDIITAGLFISSLTGWSKDEILCNPYLKFVIFSLLLTGLVFLIPFLYRKIVSGSLRYGLIVLSLILGIFIAIFLVY